jgi:predicted RNase H-like HicB family nuclease
MTEYLAIYERSDDGWWAYVPDLPGCTAPGDDRDDVERNAREAVAAHVELPRATGRVVPEPTTCDVGRIAVRWDAREAGSSTANPPPSAPVVIV